MTQDEDFELLRQVLELLSKASQASRTRIARALVTILNDDGAMQPSYSHRALSEDLKSTPRELNLPRFSEDRSYSPKEFILEKRPNSDVERIACLGYYLTHYRDQAEFKTQDLTALNQEAGQPRMGNAAQATDNATKGGYLIPASRGNKQISALGEQFVQALPDREKARIILRENNTRRRTVKRKISRVVKR